MDSMDRSDGKIDPTFFSTCRLCVSKPGSYQILPHIQKQIKDLFDISVHVYDGLPQLLCEECRIVVAKVHALRSTYQTKQKELISRNRVLHKPEDVDGDVKCPKEEDESKGPVKGSLLEVGKSSAGTAASSPEPGSDKSSALPMKRSPEPQITDCHSVTGPKSEEKSEVKLKLIRSAKSRWVQRYACRFCDQQFRQFKSLVYHLQTHSALVEAQSEFKVRHCFVSLPRCEPPNCVPGRAQKLADETVCTAPGEQVENVFANYFIRTQRHLTEEIYKLSCDERLRPQRKHHYDLDPDDHCISEKKRKKSKIIRAVNKATVEYEAKDRNDERIEAMGRATDPDKNVIESSIKIITPDQYEHFKPDNKREKAKIIRAADKATIETKPKERNVERVGEIDGATVPVKNIIEYLPKIIDNWTKEECRVTNDHALIVDNRLSNESDRIPVEVSKKQYICSDSINPAQETEKATQRPFIKCIPTASLSTAETAAVAATPSPLNIVMIRLQFENFLLTDDLKSIAALKDFRALAIYDLYLTAYSPKMVISLFVCAHRSNFFCINAVDARGRLSIANEPPAHQLKILQSLLKSYVINTIRSMAIQVSQDVHDNTMMFLAAIKYILENHVIALYGQ